MTSRVDYRSPYKSEYEPDSDDNSFDYPAFSSASPPRTRKKKSAAPSHGYVGAANARFESAAYPPPPSAMAVPRAQTARPTRASKSPARTHRNGTGVTPTREELRRLDEELARARAEQEESDAAWEVHAIHNAAHATEYRSSSHVAPGVGVASVPTGSSSSFPSPPPHVSSRLPRPPPRERSNSDPEAHLSTSCAEEFDSPPNTSFSAHVSPVRDLDDGEEDAMHEVPTDCPSTHPATTPHARPVTAAAGRDTAVQPSSSSRLSQQELLINAEIESIERSLNEMSSFAAARGAARRERAKQTSGEGHTQAQAQPSHTTDKLRTFANAHADLQSEWKRTVPSHAADVPLHSSAMSPQRHAANAAFSSFSPPRSSHLSPAATLDAQGVTRLTMQFESLAREVESFWGDAANHAATINNNNDS